MERTEEIKQRRHLAATRTAQLLAHTQLDPASVIERNSSYYKRAIVHTELRTVTAVERLIRGDQTTDLAPSIEAAVHGKPVGRLHEADRRIEPKGFGTGFLVATNILITNNHVFNDPASARACAVNFFYEKDERTGSINEGFLFLLNPDKFFYTCEELDFSLVYVESLSMDNKEFLSNIEPLPLIATKGKVKVNSKLNIIQYPGGGVKKYAMDDNVITSIDDDSGTLFYSTDTQTGSSGSPCFNQFWEVAGLHFTSVPRVDSNGRWLTKDNELWDEEMGDDAVDWIANAGKSISKIINHLKNVKFNADAQRYVDLVLQRSKDPLENESKNLDLNNINANQNAMQNITMHFHSPTTIYINGPVPNGPQEATALKIGEGLLEKKELFDEDYSNRLGYDSNFIEGFTVPMPTIDDKYDDQLYKKAGSTLPYIIPYHHYSLVMNKKRRMLMWAASNVDYNPKLRDSRSRTDLGSGAWRIDYRVPTEYQIQAEEFYDPATLIDKGHIIRRDDNCWAKLLPGDRSDSIAIEYHNADTFHWTNCTPQHEAFNRDMEHYKGVGLWGVLENAIKEQLEFTKNTAENANKDYGQKACVIGGPIFSDNDPEFMGIKYPLKFFKVFAIRSRSEGNLVYAFLLDQADKIKETGLMKKKKLEGLPRFEEKVQALQVSLKKIEELSGVLFDKLLHDADVKRGDDSEIDIIASPEKFKTRKSA